MVTLDMTDVEVQPAKSLDRALRKYLGYTNNEDPSRHGWGTQFEALFGASVRFQGKLRHYSSGHEWTVNTSETLGPFKTNELVERWRMSQSQRIRQLNIFIEGLSLFDGETPAEEWYPVKGKFTVTRLIAPKISEVTRAKHLARETPIR